MNLITGLISQIQVDFIFRINVYVNFNKAVEIKIDHRMTLNEFEKIVSKNMAPSRCPKIYFNGLLLRDGHLRLISYGVKDRSSLYINTENVVGRCAPFGVVLQVN